MEWFVAYRESITLGIAIISFMLSVYNFVKNCWDLRCALRISYKSHTAGKHQSGKTILVLRLIFENQSAAKTSVTRIFLNHKGKRYEFAFPENQVWEFESKIGNVVKKRECVVSQRLPFAIEGYGAVGGYFVAYLPLELCSDFSANAKIELDIQTNRKMLHTSLVADNPGYDSQEYGHP